MRKMKRVLSLVLCICMVLSLMPAMSLEVEAATTPSAAQDSGGTAVQAGTPSEVNLAEPVTYAVSYTRTYTGSQSNLTLSSGSYLLNGTTVTSSAGSSAITISSGATVTLYIQGSVTVTASAATSAGKGGGAGIYVPSGATLTIRRAPGATSATLKVTGAPGASAGAGGNASGQTPGSFGIGAGGGGAAIGTPGGSGVSSSGAAGNTGATAGNIYLDNDVSYTLTAGSGGAAARGGNGANATGSGSKGGSGGGGGGGGGNGAPGALIGTGGQAGGSGGTGGRGGYDDWTNWVIICGGGGGGGGKGHDMPGGGGGGGGGAASAQGKSLGGDGLVLASGGSGGAVGHYGSDGGDAYSKGGGLYADRTADGGEHGYSTGNGGATSVPDDSIDTKPSAGSNGSKTTVSWGTTYYPWVFKDGFTGQTISYAMVKSTASPSYPSYPTANHCGFTGWSGVSTHSSVLKVVTANFYSHNYTYSASGTTITATCKNSGCYLSNGGSVKLNNPGDTIYSGSSHVATTSGSFLSNLGTPTLSYAYNASSASSYTAISGSPVKCGYYQATLTAPDGKTKVSVSFRINHNYSNNNLCPCGSINPDSVATVSKNGTVVSAHTTLADAITAVANCTAADKAVVTLLKEINQGSSYQTISSGVFTIDLNGKALSSTGTYGLYLSGSGVNVTIIDSGNGGSISGKTYGVYAQECGVTITGGTISGDSYGLFANNSIVTISGGSISGGMYAGNNSTVTISGGSISSVNCGVYAYSSTVTISGGSISSVNDGVYAYSSTVTISGGTISGEVLGVDVYNSTVTISGGSISATTYDIYNYNSTVTLTLGEDGVGATFPGGITVYNTTLNAILGEGAAYWQGNTMVIPTDGAEEISGGDVVIKSTCPHTASKSNYTDLKDGANHTCYCSGCNNTITENHTYDATTLLCPCGAVSPDAVVSTTIGETTTYFTTLDAAIQAVATCTAADKAVVTLLKEINQGSSYQTISSGVFTIDLNGKALSSTGTYGLYLSGSRVNVTIIDSGNGGSISGKTHGVLVDSSTVTISGGSISGGNIRGHYGVNVYRGTVTISGGNIRGHYGVNVYRGTVTISGGNISGSDGGVYASNNSTVTISGGNISGSDGGVYASNNSTVTISGGTISGEFVGVYAETDSTVTISGGSISATTYDIYNYNSTVTLTLGEDGVGATFPGGITVYNTTLNATLGEGAAYWQGNTMVIPTDGAEEISGGDVVIKSTCPHTASKSNYTDLKDGANHTYICSGCNNTLTEAHSYNTTTLMCACGAVSPDAVVSTTINGITTGYTTLKGAIQAVANCTAADKAVVTLLKEINQGSSYQTISSGVFTIDLNGKALSSTRTYGLYLSGSGVNVTIIDSGNGGSISGDRYGVYAGNNSTVTVTGGTISGSTSGVRTDHVTLIISGGSISGDSHGLAALNNSTVTISGGSISGKTYGVYAQECGVTISGGSISGDYGVEADNSTVTISGGSISGGSGGVYAYSSTVTISGGTISGELVGVYAYNSTVTISGGSISSDYGVEADNSTVTISGGSISGTSCDINNYNSTVTLTLGEDGVGATFPGGITVYNTTLNATLGEGAAYWAGDTMLAPADEATEITDKGDITVKAACTHASGTQSYVNNGDDHTYTWSCCNLKVTEGHTFADCECLCGATNYLGWTQIDGSWYYFYEDQTKATGIIRVPYPAEAINGVTYAPNAEDVAYYENKGQTFIDKDTALFIFDENGVFQSSQNGLTSDNRWAVNGHIAWHVGLVQIGEDYYYFTGNSEIGGNKMYTGDIYANRNTTDFDLVVGGVYTFGSDGKLCKYDGITKVDGVLRYYENAQLMMGNGLTKVGENYIYVDSNGALVVDAEYYVPGNDLGIASGVYNFDENGYMIEPVSTDKDGIYYENGAWYYYENGKIGYNKGLISVNTTWHAEDGSENVYSGYIYVRSSGKLATGEYYITNVSDDSGMFRLGQKVSFSELGIADAPKHGIVDVDGTLYFYQYGQIQYNAGLIEYNGGWIYVRSSGKLATGAYWITNTNGEMDQGMYEFGEDGYLVITDTEDGIVNENGVLYYYLDGKKQYGLGLVQLEDGTYIYVRTNGELATGSYWITNHNGLLPEGIYTFGEDGILTVN